MADVNDDVLVSSRGGAFALINLVLRRPGAIVVPGLILGLAVGLYTFSQARTYASTASFIPYGPAPSSGRLTGLAAQFGVSLGDQGHGQSPEFYADLLLSQEILRQVALREYRIEVDGGVREGDLGTVLEIEVDEDLQLFEAIRFLEDVVEAQINPRTGIVEVKVSVRWRSLARDLVQALLDTVNEFNLATRQSSAASERVFVEGRLKESEEELLAAEDEMEEFLVSNRQFDSPQLGMEMDRIQRRILRRQAVVTSLASALEQARIDEVRNTPVITVIERPRQAVKPNGRGTVRRAVTASALGMLFSFALIVVLDRLALARAQGSEEVNEFFYRLGGLKPGRRHLS